MTTKEKAGYDFDMMLERQIVFLQFNFTYGINVVFEHDSFWKEVKTFPLPGSSVNSFFFGRSTLEMYEQPIVAKWIVKGKGMPMIGVSKY